MRLQNKRVIITGGSTGIGAAVARRFLAEGAKVAVWCRNPDNAKAIAAELPDLTVVAAVDVADAEGVDRAFAQSLERLGGLDVLICNAGISIRHGFVDIPREEFDRVLRVNVHGVFYVSQLAARHMLAQVADFERLAAELQRALVVAARGCEEPGLEHLLVQGAGLQVLPPGGEAAADPPLRVRLAVFPSVPAWLEGRAVEPGDALFARLLREARDGLAAAGHVRVRLPPVGAGAKDEAWRSDRVIIEAPPM